MVQESVNNMAVDELVTKGARTSAAMILTHFSLNIPVSAPEVLTCMMTSPNGNIFRVTGLLCVEFTGHQLIPQQNFHTLVVNTTAAAGDLVTQRTKSSKMIQESFNTLVINTMAANDLVTQGTMSSRMTQESFIMHTVYCRHTISHHVIN